MTSPKEHDVPQEARFVVGPLDSIEDVDAAACAPLGYSRRELLGMHGADLVPTERHGRTAVSLDRMRHGDLTVRDGLLKRKDGGPHRFRSKRESSGRVGSYSPCVSAGLRGCERRAPCAVMIPAHWRVGEMRARSLGIAGLGLVLVLPSSALSAEIVVFAAASLTDALQEIRAGYEASSTDRLVFNFGASSDLARQIRAGAPADVFFSADVAQMEGLEKEGLVRREDRIDVLSNALVAIVPLSSTLAIHAPRDLLAVKRLAVASPEAVPAGVYVRKYLESIGLWQELEGRVVPTMDVRASLAAVEAEHADAGMVYRTDAALSRRVRVAFEVPREKAPPIVYPLSPVVGSKHAEAAAAVVRHLVGAEASRSYRRFGFIVRVAR